MSIDYTLSWLSAERVGNVNDFVDALWRLTGKGQVNWFSSSSERHLHRAFDGVGVTARHSTPERGRQVGYELGKEWEIEAQTQVSVTFGLHEFHERDNVFDPYIPFLIEQMLRTPGDSAIFYEHADTTFDWVIRKGTRLIANSDPTAFPPKYREPFHVLGAMEWRKFPPM